MIGANILYAATIGNSNLRTALTICSCIVIISSLGAALFGLQCLLMLAALPLIYLIFRYERFSVYFLIATVQIIAYTFLSLYTVYIYVLTLAIILLWLARRMLINNRPLLISKFLFYYFLCLFIASVISGLQGGLNWNELLVLVRYLIFIPLVLILYDMLDIKHTLFLFIAATIPILFSCGLVLYKYSAASGFIEIFELTRMKLRGIFTNSNTFGSIIILLLPFWIAMAISTGNRVIKYLYWAISIILSLTIFLINSRAAFVAFIWIVISYSMWLKRVKYLIAVILLIIVALLSYPSGGKIIFLALGADRADSHRIEIWENTIKIIKENIVLGVGIGSFRKEYAPYFKTAFDRGTSSGLVFHAHNLILSKMAELGIAGLILIIILYYYPLRKGWEALHRKKVGKYTNMTFGLICGISAMFVRSIFEGRGILEEGAVYPEILFWILFILILKMEQAGDNEIEGKGSNLAI